MAVPGSDFERESEWVLRREGDWRDFISVVLGWVEGGRGGYVD